MDSLLFFATSSGEEFSLIDVSTESWPRILDGQLLILYRSSTEAYDT